MINFIEYKENILIHKSITSISDYSNWYRNKTNFDPSKFSKKLSVFIKEGYPTRPKRVFNPADKFFWRGWLTGEFALTDYQGGMSLVPQNNIIEDTGGYLSEYMLDESSWILVPYNTQIPNLKSLNKIIKDDQGNSDEIKIIHYKNHQIKYQINLTEDKMIIFNEIYFPGWQRVDMGKNKNIDAISIAKTLRGYKLKKGKYIFTEQFNMPYWDIARAVSLTTFIILIMILFLFRKKHFIKHNN